MRQSTAKVRTPHFSFSMPSSPRGVVERERLHFVVRGCSACRRPDADGRLLRFVELDRLALALKLPLDIQMLLVAVGREAVAGKKGAARDCPARRGLHRLPWCPSRSDSPTHDRYATAAGGLKAALPSPGYQRGHGRLATQLSRRRRAGTVTWAQFRRLEKCYSLPRARVVHGLQSRVAKS